MISRKRQLFLFCRSVHQFVAFEILRPLLKGNLISGLSSRVTCNMWQVCLKIAFKGEVCYKRNMSLGKAARNYIKISLFFERQMNEVYLLTK